jgi:TM2 domain-containing membrane protein YozV/RNA polymerase subunit RPABC4/transcription elongation factor Spt4
MHCRNCGKAVDEKAAICVSCGVPPNNEKKFCGNCGVKTEDNQAICVKCGVSLSTIKQSKGLTPKIITVLFCFFFGFLGAHKFYLGYKKEGYIIMLAPLLSLLIIFLSADGFINFVPKSLLKIIVVAMPLLIYIIVLVEFFIYLFKSDEDFEKTYIQNKKGWL